MLSDSKENSEDRAEQLCRYLVIEFEERLRVGVWLGCGCVATCVDEGMQIARFGSSQEAASGAQA